MHVKYIVCLSIHNVRVTTPTLCKTKKSSARHTPSAVTPCSLLSSASTLDTRLTASHHTLTPVWVSVRV